MSKQNPFKGFHSRPDVIRLAVMMMGWTPPDGIDVSR
jgi:hypothetical protein